MALVYLALLCSINLAAQDEASVSGRVVHAKSGAPIERAKVFTGFGGADQLSDKDGAFRIERLKPGSYQIRAEKGGFVVGLVIGLRLAPGEAVRDLQIRLEAEAVLSGSVKDPNGTAVPASVTVLAWDSGAHVAAQFSKDGAFRITKLAAGKYRVYAQAQLYGGPNYALTYYPGQADASNAEMISVAAGELREAVNISLQEIQLITIRGHFAGACPAAYRCSVGYVYADMKRTGSTTNGSLDEAGNFTLRVPAGDWRVRISAFPTGQGQPLTLGQKEIRVLVQDEKKGIEGVMIETLAVRTVQARYEWAAANPGILPKTPIVLNPIDGIGILQRLMPGDDGLLVSTQVGSGKYSIAPMGLPKGLYVSRILAGDAEITASGLDLSSGPSPLLRLQLASDGAYLSGSVSVDGAATKSGCQVIVFRDSPSRAERELYTTMAVCDAQASYSVSGLAPGTYKVRARVGDRLSEAEPQVLKAGEVRSLNLKVP